MKVLVTGAHGFLGWHTRVRLRALTPHEVIPVGRDAWDNLGGLMEDCDAVIHIAGVNRGKAAEVENGNVVLAQELAAAVRTSRVQRIVYANTIWSGRDTPYGIGKHRAAEILAHASKLHGVDFVDIRLPNLFGEGGRPGYNSFVATFIDDIVSERASDVRDREISLLPAQQAAAALISGLDCDNTHLAPKGTPTTVQLTYSTLVKLHRIYQHGDIPPLNDPLSVDLFNSLRYSMFPGRYPIQVSPHSDQRGILVEAVRTHGGEGQIFASTTRPGATRGEHFHLRKVERFLVVRGTARISLRRTLTRDAVAFDVSGDKPAIVDMPTLWTHNIVNTGRTELVTLFWTNELFNPGCPDTYHEAVCPGQEASSPERSIT